MKEKIIKELKSVIKNKYSINLDNLTLDNPPKKELGDFAFATFVLAKDLKKNPNEIAQELSNFFEKSDFIEKALVSGAYINIKISKKFFTESFYCYYKELIGDKLFTKKDENIIVDYIGANVGKPLHIGHMCTPNVGQVIINLNKKLGYNVISDSHIGDWGIIFGKLIVGYKLWGDEEKLKTDAVEHLLELYIKLTAEIEKQKIDGDSQLEEKTRKEFKKLSSGDKESIKFWQSFTSYSIKSMQKELDRLNIKPDFNIGESFYEGLGLPKLENYPDLKFDMKSIVKELIEKKIATKNDDNSVGVEFEESSKIPSCILRKRDGTHGYLASDLACIKYRVYNWDPEKVIYFVDVRQSLHFRQAFEIARKAGWLGKTNLIHAPNGFISLKDGAMSTRKGKIIKLDKLLDESEKRAKDIILSKGTSIKGQKLEDLGKIIGIGAIKYGYLKKSRETDIIFDWDEFMSFEGNSGPYIQYAYVRSKKILEKYSDSDDLEDLKCHIDKEKMYFDNDEEIDLIKKLMDYKSALQETKEKNMPHILCKYTYELTKSFSSFYNNIHILNEKDENKKYLRIKLIYLFSKTLEELFEILAIDLPEEM